MVADSTIEASLQQALYLAEVGRVDEAVTRAERVLATEPDSVPALRVLAYALSQAGRFEQVLETAYRATALAPADVFPRLLTVQALIELNCPGPALEAAREAVALDPQQANAQVLLAYALLATGGTRNVLTAAQATARARSLNPELVAAHVAEGDVQRRMARFGRARAAYRQALALAPDHHGASYLLGALDADRGRALRASPLLGRALTAAPNDPITLLTAARGARRALWLITDAAQLIVFVTVIAAALLRTEIAGPVGVTLGLTTSVCGHSAAFALIWWRIDRLSAPTQALIHRLRSRPTFALAVVRLVASALGGLLLVVDPAPGRGTFDPMAVPLTCVPLLLLVLRARNWLALEVSCLLRRTWFMVAGLFRRAGPG